jgi:transcriptional regulator with XRE-family HTH domain
MGTTQADAVSESLRNHMPKTLRELRIEKGETIEQTAAALSVHTASVGAWELGKQRPWPKHVPAIAAHFGISAQDARESIEETRRQSEAAAAK